MTEFVYSNRKSWCHNEMCLIVKSFTGGFVPQDCNKCGNSMYLSFNELPEIKYKCCGKSNDQWI